MNPTNRWKPKAIFFDLDHTLWDFEKNSGLTFEYIFKKRCLDLDVVRFLDIYRPINLEFWRLYRSGAISKEVLRYQRLKTAFDQLNWPIADPMIHLLAEDYIAHLSSFTNLLPGAKEILIYLQKKYPLYILTNGFREVQTKKLQHSGLAPFFSAVIDSESVGVKKPHPKIFEHALEIAGVLPNEAVLIGDSFEADVEGALQAGLHAIHYIAHGEPLHEQAPIIHELLALKKYF